MAPAPVKLTFICLIKADYSEGTPCCGVGRESHVYFSDLPGCSGPWCSNCAGGCKQGPNQGPPTFDDPYPGPPRRF